MNYLVTTPLQCAVLYVYIMSLNCTFSWESISYCNLITARSRFCSFHHKQNPSWHKQMFISVAIDTHRWAVEAAVCVEVKCELTDRIMWSQTNRQCNLRWEFVPFQKILQPWLFAHLCISWPHSRATSSDFYSQLFVDKENLHIYIHFVSLDFISPVVTNWLIFCNILFSYYRFCCL